MKALKAGLLLAVALIAFMVQDESAIAQEGPNHLTHGPTLGRLSAHGVGVWARTSEPGEFVVRYGLTPQRLDASSDPVTTHLENDNTGWAHITGLKSNTLYYYEIILPVQPGPTARRGSFRTLPDSRDYVDRELNPDGRFNFSFECACGNNQNRPHGSGPELPTFATMLRELKGRIHFAILNGDWLYEARRTYQPEQWLAQVNRSASDLPETIKIAPTLVGVWENYKYFLDQGKNLERWHREIPSFFTYDDHEMLNDIWGAGSPGLRDRRAVFRDIGAKAWYDYLGWSNPTQFTQRVHFGVATLRKGRDVLHDPNADFTQLDMAQPNNLHVHWGTKTAGVNDNALDGVGGVENAGVYRIVKVLDGQ